MPWRSTGIKQEIGIQQQKSGRVHFTERYKAATSAHEHLWLATMAYYVTPPLQHGTILDYDNIALDPTISCFICEEEYTPELAAQPCRGEPQ